MSRRAIVFTPQNLFPPRSGFHLRAREMIDGLRAVGFRVVVAGWTGVSQTPWPPGTARQVRRDLGLDLRLYRPTMVEFRLGSLLARYHRLRKVEPGFGAAAGVPLGLRRWFGRVVDSVRPDLVLMNYASWDPLLDRRRLAGVQTVVDTQDLQTLNMQMWAAVDARLPATPANPAAVADDVLDERFFDRLGLTPDPREFAVLDRYDDAIAIARDEADLMTRRLSHARVRHIPMTVTPRPSSNRYDGPAVFPAGLNPFNVQGYLYFVRRVLPLVLAKCPTFRLVVTGPLCKAVRRVPGVELAGFVPDLATVYRPARFLLNPVYGGTGQQVKIVEGMSYGLPVVCLAAAAAKSPVADGRTGLVAADAAAFADHVVRLWTSPALCRALGEAARDTVVAGFSKPALYAALAELASAGPLPRGGGPRGCGGGR